MNTHLKIIRDFLNRDNSLSTTEKDMLLKSLNQASQEFEIVNFKLDRTEKVKRTTAILLEETIEELEQKRKAVEGINRELEIESSLERVRTVAMSMGKADDMLLVCRIISEQLELLKVKNIRNVQTAIIYEETGTYLNHEYYSKLDKTFITEVDYNLHPAQFEFVSGMLKGPEEFFCKKFNGEEVQDWYRYQKTTPQFPDPFLETASSLNYYWYSMGAVALGISTYAPLTDDEIVLFKRFRNVFEMAHRRFKDIEKAEAQALVAGENLLKIQTEKKRAEEALSELQITQKQLIQSEKMASLGELTAGIAHEIQNPLNFVNNFSEVSNELIKEIQEERSKSNEDRDQDLENELLTDIWQNLEKINHHGKRADAIVKGMLQHSRSSNGQKEPTDINALCDEYWRLTYHGLRAKDKSFNATIITNFDQSLPKINILPQDIGRVILNLLTNAFYAVNEKKKQIITGYEPTVTLSTKHSLLSATEAGSEIEIKVADNGNGIPENLIDKIFQPFFTTKPTGQGTGLGLSMSYDIITKGHGGRLTPATVAGEGSTFIIHLPVI